ncbi:MAG: peptidoglycan DD-metalloendopeptidase family protein [Thermoflexales bacterium]|nr:peptidoglycan DD-metalloendopeptidase family protein [Thermoflexales bacterium]
MPTAVIEAVATPPPIEPPLQPPPISTSPGQHVVQVGDTLHALSAETGYTIAALAEPNRVTNVHALLAGQPLRLPGPLLGRFRLHRVSAGDTLTLLAAQYGVSPKAIQKANALACRNCLIFGQLVRIPDEAANGSAAHSTLPAPFISVQVLPALPKQGDVVAVQVKSSVPLQDLAGTLGERTLRFAEQRTPEGGLLGYIALSGIEVTQEPGVYPVALRAITAEGLASQVQGRIQVGARSYGFENLVVNQKLVPLLDPMLNVEERDSLAGLINGFTGTQYWTGPFVLPIRGKILSYFGARRNFNRGMLYTYHTGVDFSASVGTPVRAAAPGKIVATDSFPIRGNTIVIDHGRGVYTTYCHLSRFNVEPGALVQAGDVIGYSGNTGRTLGPHLHWELAVGGVLVNPLVWVNHTLP